jgi:extracellular factor (EF) 3-hydroxypalmitic acid methyl ester biosynthesis protein
MNATDDALRLGLEMRQWASDLASEEPKSKAKLTTAPYHVAKAFIHRFAAIAGAMEKHGLSSEAVASSLEMARGELTRSAFIKRLQTWPRGYPGDFETIDCLLGDTSAGTTDAAGLLYEQAALSLPIAMQHRFKVVAQAQIIEETLMRRGPDARILVLAVGSAPDLRRVRWNLFGIPKKLVIADWDAAALTSAQSAMISHGIFCEKWVGDLVSVLKELRSEHFDAIVAGGIFDYLTDRTGKFVIGRCRQMLASGGVFFFTNIRTGNPYRVLIEHAANWRLIERDAPALMSLTADNAPDQPDVDIAPDETGLALLVRCTAS